MSKFTDSGARVSSSIVPVILFALLAGSCSKQLPPAQAQLTRACEFLWDAQEDSGGWHSKHHGLLKGGEAWTPFTLFNLMAVPDSIYPRPAEQFNNALNFIRKRVRTHGKIGASDKEVLEYPNYATAYALRILQQSTQKEDTALARAMTDYLVRQQFIEKRGIDSDHPAYGSWGFGETTLKKGATGHIDLSHTRRVLQALAGSKGTEINLAKSQLFLRLLQKQPHEDRSQPAGSSEMAATFDGGFYFSPTILDANKGGIETRDSTSLGMRSYATATCDGILALLASGAKESSAPVQAAAEWLADHPLLDYPQGIPHETPEQWHKVLFYYHLAVRSEVYRALDWPGNWRSDIYLLLRDKQQENGSFVNPFGALNKEDDPILATSLAVQTLLNILER